MHTKHYALIAAMASLLALPNAEAVVSTSPDQPVLAQIPVDQLIIKLRVPAKPSAAAVGAEALRQIDAASGIPITMVRTMSGGELVVKVARAVPAATLRDYAKRLAQSPLVEYAEPDVLMQPHFVPPNDPLFGANVQWPLYAPPGAPAGEPVSMGGANFVGAWNRISVSPAIVAVIDTGVLPNHVDLAGRLLPGYDLVFNATLAGDGDGFDPNPADPGTGGSIIVNGNLLNCVSNWHGTFVAAQIGANSQNATGMTGANRKANILPIRALGKCGLGFTSDIADAIRWAVGAPVPGATNNPPANKARVINLSLGGEEVCGPTMQNAINTALAASPAVTVVVSAGNSTKSAALFSPANCAGVITVAASTATANAASYSNFGAPVAICAPGGDSAGPVRSASDTGTFAATNSNTYTNMWGTSMAAPHVSAAASLMLGLRTLAWTSVKNILQQTARPCPSGTTCNATTCGSGLLNVGAAVNHPSLTKIVNVGGSVEQSPAVYRN